MRRPWSWVIGGGIICLGLFMCLLLVCRLFGTHRSFSSYFHGAVAVLEVNGPIAQADDFLTQVEHIRKADHLRAVVLRVNSPGGSVGASQEMFYALQRLAAAKPLVASFGSVAASGGYYIGLAAKKIYVLPGTITASIGVRMSVLEAEALLRWAGLKPDILKSGEFKDVGAIHRPMRDNERALLLQILHTMHQQFKEAVATARNLPIEKVDAIADGRILTGSEAITAGLADATGDLQDAINDAAQMAGMSPDPEVVRIHDEFPWWMELMKGMVGNVLHNQVAAFISTWQAPVFGYSIDSVGAKGDSHE